MLALMCQAIIFVFRRTFQITSCKEFLRKSRSYGKFPDMKTCIAKGELCRFRVIGTN